MALENTKKQAEVDTEELYDKYCQKQKFRKEINNTLFSNTPYTKEDIWLWGAFANEKIIGHIKNNEDKEVKILLYKKLMDDFSFLHELFDNSQKLKSEKKKLESIDKALTQRTKEELQNAITQLEKDLKTLDRRLEREKTNKKEQETKVKAMKKANKEKSKKKTIEDVITLVGEVLRK